MSVIKFIGILALLYILTIYIPFGNIVAGGIILYSLWKIVND